MSVRAYVTAAGLALAVGLVPAAGVGAAATKDRSCRATSASVAAGGQVRLALDCRVRSGGRPRTVAKGRTGKAVRSVVTKARHGTLAKLDARGGTVRYTPKRAFAGTDRAVFRLRLPDGRRYRLAVTIKVRKAPVVKPPVVKPPVTTSPAPAPPVAPPPVTAPAPPTTPTPEPEPEPEPEPYAGAVPAVLPLAPSSVAATNNWQPQPAYPTLHPETTLPTCPKALHDRYAVIGPDGKRYPSWHPPTVVDPATGVRCTFGHEHGRDPRGSNLFRWVAAHFAEPGRERYAGLPFGLSGEALDAWRAAGHATPGRAEDNPGYKVDYRNDVRRYAKSGADLGITCDELVSYHQGSHSADATANNVHELVYAVRCSDGTELISTTFARYGKAGEYTRGCGDEAKVATADNGYPAGDGERFIPDATCVQTNMLVAPGRTTSAYALWEKWVAENTLHTGDDAAAGTTLAAYPARFDVFDPARFADPDPAVTPVPGAATRIGRPLDQCWATGGGGTQVDRRYAPCLRATEEWSVAAPYDYRDPQSPFNGTTREVRLRGTTVRNAGGPDRWYTDPYGGNASRTPFPGALCQLVATTDNSDLPAVQERTYKSAAVPLADGVHAPN